MQKNTETPKEENAVHRQELSAGEREAEPQAQSADTQPQPGAETPEAGATEETVAPQPPQPFKNPIHKLYDKIPLSLKQVDILVGILIAAFIIVLLVGIFGGGLFK